jgi:hypothetical protein
MEKNLMCAKTGERSQLLVKKSRNNTQVVVTIARLLRFAQTDSDKTLLE